MSMLNTVVGLRRKLKDSSSNGDPHATLVRAVMSLTGDKAC